MPRRVSSSRCLTVFPSPATGSGRLKRCSGLASAGKSSSDTPRRGRSTCALLKNMPGHGRHTRPTRDYRAYPAGGEDPQPGTSTNNSNRPISRHGRLPAGRWLPDWEQSGTIRNETEQFGTIRKDSERLGKIGKDSERFGKIGKV